MLADFATTLHAAFLFSRHTHRLCERCTPFCFPAAPVFPLFAQRAAFCFPATRTTLCAGLCERCVPFCFPSALCSPLPCAPLHLASLRFAGEAEQGTKQDTSQVGYCHGACGVAFKKQWVKQVRKGMIMEPAERPSRRNRSHKLRRVTQVKKGQSSQRRETIKRGGEQDQEELRAEVIPN